jgi:hypothetical protein
MEKVNSNLEGINIMSALSEQTIIDVLVKVARDLGVVRSTDELLEAIVDDAMSLKC